MSALGQHLLDQRIVRIWGVLNDEAATIACAQLMAMDATGDAAVTIYIASPGGPLHAAMAVVDTIDLMGVVVEVTSMGAVEGTAVAIAAAGDRRRAAPHARFLLTEPTTSSTGSASELAAWADQHQRELDRFVARLVRATGRPAEHVEADLSMGRWLSADEAVLYGLVDEVWLPKKGGPGE
ncbi:MAG TPA: ATP-dependent Clp protease proteolytic subunit [Acidimicrobiales bacterium]|nr:ATP-dependent Clp protease proteolytic subunit [Acidimicrobiales bacterium]